MSDEQAGGPAPVGGASGAGAGPAHARSLARALAFAVVLAALLHGVGLAFVPVPADPLEGAFLNPDSPDWLAAGLSLAGYDTTHNDRPPLLPALYALLYAAGLERLVSLLHPAFLLLAAWAAATLARRVSADPHAGLVAALLVLLLGKLAFVARYVMADLLAASLAALALAALADLRTNPRAAPRFALLLVAAQAAQNVLPLLFPACLLFLVVERRSFPRRALATAAAALVLSPILLAAVHLAIARAAGTPAYNLHVVYLGFLGAKGLLFYPLAALGLLGPLVPLGATGLAGRAAFDRPGRLLLGASVASVAVFFGFFYEWLAVRFLVFLAIPLAVLASAEVLRLLRGPRPWAGWAVLALHALYGNLGHVDPFWPAVPLAPGTAVVAELEKLDPAHVQPWRLRVGTAPVDWVPKTLARPERLPPGVADGLFFSREENAEIARLGAAVRPASGATGLLDPVHGVTNLYVASVALRGPVRTFDPADAGIRYVLLRRGAERPEGFRTLGEGALFLLLERDASGGH